MLFTPKSSESLYTEVTESYKVDILIFTWQIRLQRPKKESFSQCMNKDLSNISYVLGVVTCWGYRDNQDSYGNCPHVAATLLGETDTEKLIRNDCVNEYPHPSCNRGCVLENLT